jgi:hypothetical protein
MLDTPELGISTGFANLKRTTVATILNALAVGASNVNTTAAPK